MLGIKESFFFIDLNKKKFSEMNKKYEKVWDNKSCRRTA